MYVEFVTVRRTTSAKYARHARSAATAALIPILNSRMVETKLPFPDCQSQFAGSV